MATLEIGSPAPDFTLADNRGGTFRLSEHRGRPVVLVFYCDDDTEGCTVENREFSALAPEFAALGADVVALSPQDIASHRSFSARYGFAQPLLADPDHEAIEPYGLWDLKKLWGREFMGVVRVTYLVDADGRIAGVFRASRIKGHAAKVLDAVSKLVTAPN